MDPKDDVIPEALVREILRAAEPCSQAQPPPALRQRILAAAGEPEGPDLIVVRAHEGEWNEIAPGVAAKVLHDDGRARTWLARMKAGASLPAHSHPGDEECLVLEGDVEADGIAASAGDYQIALRGSRHGTVRTRGGCLLMLRSARA